MSGILFIQGLGKMNKEKPYENFPGRMVVGCNTVSFLTYFLGAYIFLQINTFLVLLYLAYCLWMEFNVLKRSCVNCFYYGRVCGFGKGKLCAVFFKKGRPESFAKRKIGFKDLLPDFLVSLLPLVGGVYLLVSDFRWATLAAVAGLLTQAFAGNAVIRGQFACKYCRQRELGCPADRLFNRRKKGTFQKVGGYLDRNSYPF